MLKHVHKRATGNKGETIAVQFLERNGFTVVDRNYLRKWGELDIVATKQGLLHFIEVKSVTREKGICGGNHNPEDNVHGLKVKHLRRIIETYMDDKGGGLDAEFQFHVLCVYMDMNSRRAHVEWFRNIIL